MNPNYAFMYGELTVAARRLADMVLFDANSRDESSYLQTMILDDARHVHQLLKNHDERVEEEFDDVA